MTIWIKISNEITPKNGKAKFSFAVKPFYDKKNITEKDFCAAKRFFVSERNKRFKQGILAQKDPICAYLRICRFPSGASAGQRAKPSRGPRKKAFWKARIYLKISNEITPKNGKAKFSFAVKPFYDKKNITEKDFCAAKRFFVSERRLIWKLDLL